MNIGSIECITVDGTGHNAAAAGGGRGARGPAILEPRDPSPAPGRHRPKAARSRPSAIPRPAPEARRSGAGRPMIDDPDARPAITERLLAWLGAVAVPFRVLEHAPVRTSAEAAAVRGTPLEAGAKALVVRADDRPIHLVLSADRRVDNARLRRVLGVRRVRFATPDELLTLTGCVPGAVPPFGNLFGLEVLVDEELTRCAEIAFNAGSRAVSVTMRCADMVRLAEARVCRFAEG
jgi:Ala-tRNA(Pro) deacylase